MKKEGITFVTGADVGRNYRAGKIRKEFDRIILACGASNPRDIDVPGRDSAGIYFAVDFLKATTKSLLDSGLEDGSFISAKDKHVLIIGGGDTGNDCAGTSIRHGCVSVTQLEMMPKPSRRAGGEQHLAGMAQNPQNRLRPGGSHKHIRFRPKAVPDHCKGIHKRRGRQGVQSHNHKPGSPKDEETGRTIMAAVEGSERNSRRSGAHSRRLHRSPGLRGRRLRHRPGRQDKCSHRTRHLPHPAQTRYSQPATCTEASPWWYGPYKKAVKPPKP